MLLNASVLCDEVRLPFFEVIPWASGTDLNNRRLAYCTWWLMTGRFVFRQGFDTRVESVQTASSVLTARRSGRRRKLKQWVNKKWLIHQIYVHDHQLIDKAAETTLSCAKAYRWLVSSALKTDRHASPRSSRYCAKAVRAYHKRSIDVMNPTRRRSRLIVYGRLTLVECVVLMLRLSVTFMAVGSPAAEIGTAENDGREFRRCCDASPRIVTTVVLSMA